MRTVGKSVAAATTAHASRGKIAFTMVWNRGPIAAQTRVPAASYLCRRLLF